MAQSQFENGIDLGFAKATDTGLEFYRHDHSVSDMEKALYLLIGLGSYSRWGIGDLLLEGLDVHGEAFAQILSARSIRSATAQKYRWVCAVFSGEFRTWRLPETQLSFTHFTLLAGLVSGHDSRDVAFAWSLRDRALREEMSCEEMESEIAAYRGDPLFPEDAEISDDAAFSTRAPLERLERLRDGLANLVDDAPADWDEILPKLEDAIAAIDQAVARMRSSSAAVSVETNSAAAALYDAVSAAYTS